MTNEQSRTELDAAHITATEQATDAAWRRFYGVLAGVELYLSLTAEPEGDALDLETFDVEGFPLALAFDRPDRLTDFADGPRPYAALPGRALVRMLAGQSIGLMLNAGAVSAMMLEPADLIWINETLPDAPDQTEARITEIAAPADVPQSVLTALDSRLAKAEGLARWAYLVASTDESGARGHLLAFVDTLPGAEDALAQSVADALAFSGADAAQIDVTHIASSADMAARLARVGLRFDIPAPVLPTPPKAPGSDGPPKLR